MLTQTIQINTDTTFSLGDSLVHYHFYDFVYESSQKKKSPLTDCKFWVAKFTIVWELLMNYNCLRTTNEWQLKSSLGWGPSMGMHTIVKTK